MNTVQLPKKANIYKAMFYFFFSKQKFITLGAINSMAFELEKDEYKRKLEAGKYSLVPEDHKGDLEKYFYKLRNTLCKALLIMLVLFSLVILFGFFLGKLNIHHSFDLKNVISVSGVFILSWATLFQFLGSGSSWKNHRLDELVGKAIFKNAFILGSFLSLLYFVL